MDINDLLQQAENEMGAMQAEMINRAVQKAIGELKITEKNLSDNLIKKIMEKSSAASGSGNQPIPKKKNLPKRIEDSCEEALVPTEKLSSIVSDLYAGNNVYLYGKAGTGKSYMASAIAKRLEVKLWQINCSQWTSPIQIVGGQTINGYEQGTLIKCWEQGGLLLLDELPKLDPNTAGLLNEALAKSADIVKTCKISKEAYDSLIKRYGGTSTPALELVKNGNDYYRHDYPVITDGKGDQIRKVGSPPIIGGEGCEVSEETNLFFVIGTGNTMLQEVGGKYSGNNRQDYSLVDRFAGSFYEVDFDLAVEEKYIYSKVRDVLRIIRNYLTERDANESVSFRTMLNFNRIYEQEVLRYLNSPYATKAIPYLHADKGEIGGKTLEDSIKSFLSILNDDDKKNLIPKVEEYYSLRDPRDIISFQQEFEQMHGCSPI